jgi:4-diphosphocytidyl-2-C-methyl-D-erythritol kinase
MHMPIRIPAPAKLNLFLHITGKRADGFHLLESLTAFTDFGDEVEVTQSDALSLALQGEFASQLHPGDNDNLVLRAARLYGQTAAITLHKNIPVGAGLGGGSSDAAATIRALERLRHTPITDELRHAHALQLGSDVPACLLGRPGWLTGTGDHVTPVTLPHGGWVLLVNPRQPLLTADVYRAFTGAFSAALPQPGSWPSVAALAAWLQNQHNALETPAIARMPVIASLLAAITSTPGCLLSRMSGSGATCFGLYAGEPAARAAANAIATTHPAWWVKPAALQN